MTYTPEEKQKIKDLLAAFSPYITAHPYFDVLYSDKAGYVWMILEDDSDVPVGRIATAGELLDYLIDNMVTDVRFAPDRGVHWEEPVTAAECAGVRRRAAPILETLPERDAYLKLLDELLARELPRISPAD